MANTAWEVIMNEDESFTLSVTVKSGLDPNLTYNWTGNVGIHPDGGLMIKEMTQSRSDQENPESRPAQLQSIQIPKEMTEGNDPNRTFDRIAIECRRLSLKAEEEQFAQQHRRRRTKETLEALAASGIQAPSEQNPYGDDVPQNMEELLAFMDRERKAGRRTIIYTDSNEGAQHIRDFLEARGIRATALTGGMKNSAEQKEQTVKKAQEGADFQVCNPMMAQAGLDLTAFPAAIWLQNSMNSHGIQQINQVQGHSLRPGQKRPVMLVFMHPTAPPRR